MSRTQNQKMGDAHEATLANELGGRQTKGSGNQWRDATDGRNHHLLQSYPFAWDGKSTYSKGIAVTTDMWEKVVEQASPEMPLLGLRFYDAAAGTARLKVAHDLVVVRLEDFADMLFRLRDLCDS